MTDDPSRGTAPGHRLGAGGGPPRPGTGTGVGAGPRRSIVPGFLTPPDSVAAHRADDARLPRANAREIAHVLRGATEQWARFAPIDDEAAWKAVRDRVEPGTAAGLVRAGREAAARPMPELTASQWRTYTLTGDRVSYEKPWYERRTAWADMLVSYCLEPGDALLDRITDMLWATCEETSWSFPACAPDQEVPDPAAPVVCLFSGLTAVGLAECLQVLRPVLPEPVVRRVEDEVQRRVITPYLQDDSWPWLYNRPERAVNNWGAVCAFGAVGAACYLERDPARLATILEKAARSMEEYLVNFDPDGGTSEGSGYWSFGFGCFCELAELVERRTGGAWNWFEAPIVERVARFPLTSRLTRTHWPTFSDSDARTGFPGPLLTRLADRFDVPDLAALAAGRAGGWGWKNANSAVTQALRSLDAGIAPAARPEPGPPPPSTWFGGLQWLLARADPADAGTLAVAVKGGHNAELHNQNDIGSLIVRSGGEDLVVDPGRGLYTKDYFNEHRYGFFVNRSWGHSVPHPAGTEQAEGVAYAATVTALRQDDDADELTLDLTGAYPAEAGLRALHRTVTLHRGDDPRVEVVDETSFHRPAVAESGFTTFAEATADGRTVHLRGERAALRMTAPPGTELVLTSEEVPLAHGPRTATRIAVRSRGPVDHAHWTVVFTPVPEV